MAIDYDAWLMSGPGGPEYDAAAADCPHCGGYLSHDDEADFGCCEACHEAGRDQQPIELDPAA